jgi:hypothetical protein
MKTKDFKCFVLMEIPIVVILKDLHTSLAPQNAKRQPKLAPV